MSKEARNRALEAICNARGRTFLAAAPLMAIVEAVQVLDEAGLLVDPDVADFDPDAPIPYTLSTPPKADDCPGRGCCHGPQQWCDSCGNVARVCDQHDCDAHGCYDCGAGKDEPHSADCETLPTEKEPDPLPCENCCGLGWRYGDDATVERCDHCAVYETDEAAQEAKAAVDRLAAASTQRSPCPVCGQGLASNGECLNFPVCRNAIIPF
jgi:hypothetical protein